MRNKAAFSLLVARRNINITCCIKVGFVIIVPVTAVNLHIRTGKNRSKFLTSTNCSAPVTGSQVWKLSLVSSNNDSNVTPSIICIQHVFVRMQHLK